MTNEIIFSPVKDIDLAKNINNSPIWKNAYKPEEMTDEVRGSHGKWFEYHVKFDGLKPVQVTKFRALN
jgi:hypothetical protein